MPTRRSAVAAALTLLLSARTVQAQTQPQRSQFLVTKGKDTVAVELFSNDGSTLTSEIYQTAGPRIQYVADLEKDGRASHVEMTRVTRTNQALGASVFFLDSLVRAKYSAPGGSETAEIRATHALPFLAVSFGLCEQIVRASHLAVGASSKIPVVRLGAGDSTTLTLSRFHKDSALFSMPDIQLKVALAPNGDVVGGLHLTQGWTIERKAVRP